MAYFLRSLGTLLHRRMCFGVSARDCPADMEWTECISTCGSTCESLTLAGSAGSCLLTPSDCLPGCQCIGGTVFDQSVGTGGSCVTPTECTCRHRGLVYKPGSTVTVDCNDWFVLMLFQHRQALKRMMIARH